MLEFRVINQTIKRVDRFDPATDSVDYLKATFNFATKDWDGLVKTALFRLGTKVYKSVIGSDNVCVVPWEVLLASSESTSSLGSKNKIFVSVTGTDGSIELPTSEVRIELATSGKAYGGGENSGTPTPDEFTQFVNTVKDEVATINDTAEAVKTATETVEKSVETVEKVAKSNETTAGIIKNSAANAFKGTASGEVVRVDDVSCIEHSANVLVHGKNFFDISKIRTTTSPVNAVISEVGEDYIIITTNDDYTGNGFSTTTQPLKEVCPSLEIGKTYTLSATTESNSTNIYFSGIGKSWVFVKAMVVTEELLNSPLTFYGLSTMHGYGTGDCRISNIQIELGTEATEYTPYIDPSTVTLTRCGKNLITAPYIHGTSRTHNGVTFTVNADGSVKVVGTATADSYFSLCKIHIFDETKIVKTDCSYNRNNDVVSIYLMSGETVNKTFYPQIEVSDTATNYEQYKGATYTPNADGTCEIVSVSPTMTLSTDTEGITIECEYNRDTNIVMGDIETAIDGILAIQNAIIGGDYS